MALLRDHDICLVQDKHPQLTGIKELKFEDPVHGGTRGPDYDVSSNLRTTRICEEGVVLGGARSFFCSPLFLPPPGGFLPPSIIFMSVGRR